MKDIPGWDNSQNLNMTCILYNSMTILMLLFLNLLVLLFIKEKVFVRKHTLNYQKAKGNDA